MCRWRRTILVAGLWGLALPSVSAQRLTEEQALARMRAENPQVRVLALTVRELEASSRDRSRLANPTVSFTREDAGPTVDDFLLVTQELPLRGRLGLLREASWRAVTAADARADSDLLAVETSLRQAFVELLFTQKRVAALDTELAVLNRFVDVLRRREVEGEGSLFDRLRAEREVADIQLDLDVGQIDRLSAQASVASFFAPGFDPTDLEAAGELVDAVPVPPLDVLLARALASRSDYLALTFEEARWETERRAAERLKLPRVSVTAGWKRSHTSLVSDSGYAVTANVAVPAFNRGGAQVTRAEVARARVEAERQALHARIDSEVRRAHAAASRYRELVGRYRSDAVARATDLVSIATAAYEEGEYGILEVMDAHRVQLDVELRLLTLSATARGAAIDLDAATGGRTMP